jgi:hypothetical protein
MRHGQHEAAPDEARHAGSPPSRAVGDPAEDEQEDAGGEEEQGSVRTVTAEAQAEADDGQEGGEDRQGDLRPLIGEKAQPQQWEGRRDDRRQGAMDGAGERGGRADRIDGE